MKKIDARGMACPQPVLMTKKAVASKPKDVEVTVDSVVARNNVEKLLKSSGYRVSISNDAEDFKLEGVRG